jgi:Zn-dependent peptidase ImmA (M78 family)
MPDPLSVTSKNEVWRIAAKANADDRRFGMAHGIAHCLLRNSQQTQKYAALHEIGAPLLIGEIAG